MSTTKPTNKIIQLPRTAKETQLHSRLGLPTPAPAKDSFVRGDLGKDKGARLAHLLGGANVESNQQKSNSDRLAKAFGDIGSELGISQSPEEAGIPKEWLA